MGPPAKKSRPSFRTSLPFTETHWPQLRSDDRDNILDLLCSLLQPLGDHRRAHILPSKGKKRKRKPKSTSDEHPQPPSNATPEAADLLNTAPPPPEIGSHILIGLNSVTRHLEALAARNAPPSMPAPKGCVERESETTASSTDASSTAKAPPLRPLSLILIPHNHPPASLAHAHLPTLVHLSTLSNPASSAPRLLAVPPGCEARLASTLHIPHVGAIGVMDGAPGADALAKYVREHVGVTECKWVDEAMRGEWRGVKIDVSSS